MTQEPLSLSEPFGSDDDGRLEERVADRFAPTPLDLTEGREIRTGIGNLLHHLAPREERVIRMRFGLDQSGGRTLEEIGRELSVTRERIRQIELDALQKLKQPPMRRLLKDLLGLERAA